jgi:hypothetical protein
MESGAVRAAWEEFQVAALRMGWAGRAGRDGGMVHCMVAILIARGHAKLSSLGSFGYGQAVRSWMEMIVTFSSFKKLERVCRS